MEAELKEALQKNKAISLFANCSVRYSGRAESYLGAGDRFIIIKSDGTLLVHQPQGSAPVNYMKDGSAHDVILENGEMQLKSQNLALKEYLDITLHTIHSFHTAELTDGEKIQLMGSEKDMSDMIYNNPELISADFKPISREEQTKYGFLDVFGYDKDNNLVIIECKRYIADLKAVDQLERYVKKMKELRGINNIRGIIAAPKITPNAKDMLNNRGFEFCSLAPPNNFERYDKDQKKLGEY